MTDKEALKKRKQLSEDLRKNLSLDDWAKVCTQILDIPCEMAKMKALTKWLKTYEKKLNKELKFCQKQLKKTEELMNYQKGVLAKQKERIKKFRLETK